MTGMLHIEKAIAPEALSRLRARLDAATWSDGRATAGNLSSAVKHNRQLAEDDPVAAEQGAVLLDALSLNALFTSAALPALISPPIFNCYGAGEEYGAHIDGAIRPLARGRMRTDLSATLFIDDPGQYDGGELLIESAGGEHSVKLPAGDLILYDATSIHRVAPLRRGRRRAAVFWVQSLVGDTSRRGALHGLDLSIQRLRGTNPGHSEILPLTALYHNLLRMWAAP